MRYYKCDKCGSEIPAYRDVIIVSVHHEDTVFEESYQEFELCSDCAGHLYQWLCADDSDSEESEK